MEKGEGGGVVTRSCDSEIKVDEQCHYLKLLKIFEITLKLIISWGLLWVFQKLLHQKQIDIWFDKIESGVSLGVVPYSDFIFRGQNLVKNWVKNLKNGSLQKRHAPTIYSNKFIYQHTMEYIKVHYQ